MSSNPITSKLKSRQKSRQSKKKFPPSDIQLGLFASHESLSAGRSAQPVEDVNQCPTVGRCKLAYERLKK